MSSFPPFHTSFRTISTMSSFGNSCSVSPRAWKCKEELCCQRRHLVCTFVDNVLFHFREQQGSCFPKMTADKNILFADKNNVFDPHWWQVAYFYFPSITKTWWFLLQHNYYPSFAAQLLPTHPPTLHRPLPNILAKLPPYFYCCSCLRLFRQCKEWISV